MTAVDPDGEIRTAREWLAIPPAERYQRRYLHLMPTDARGVLRLTRRRYVPPPKPAAPAPAAGRVQERRRWSFLAATEEETGESPAEVQKREDEVRERQGLLRRTRCGLCDQVFNCAELSSSATRRSIVELRAGWGYATPTSSASRPSSLYQRVQLCIFCAQFFDHSPPCFDDSQVERSLAKDAPEPSAPRTNNNEPATRFAASPAPREARPAALDCSFTAAERKRLVRERVERRVLELMGDHPDGPNRREVQAARRQRRQRLLRRAGALSAVRRSEGSERTRGDLTLGPDSPAGSQPPAARWPLTPASAARASSRGRGVGWSHSSPCSSRRRGPPPIRCAADLIAPPPSLLTAASKCWAAAY
eukprot:TRINITY_DN4023_c0_g1_i2.p2 TRINITY_DN4023_c0_g1~~TRINITY_DN4023_c0_g1_i2.p2  ORF type:complete len:397 (+),score=125.59 TRINITY_DN4023_c0_g1_i2:104-1192(+)